MLRRLYPVAAVSAALLPGCRTAEPAASDSKAVVEQFADDQIPKISCPDGAEFDTFIFDKLEGTAPALSTLGLPAPTDGAPPPAIATSSPTAGVRLDLCVTGEHATLVRVVSLGSSHFDSISIPALAKVEGLEDAIFEQNYAKLAITVPFESFQKVFSTTPKPSNDQLLIKGMPAASGSGGYAVATFTTVDEGGTVHLKAESNRVLVGALAFGDFPSNPCLGGGTVSGAFQISTAHFQWSGCQFIGTSGGTAPTLHQLVITDTAAQLPDSVRGKPQTVVLDETPTGNYKEKSNHHSVCDSMRVEVPTAVYAMTASIAGFGGGTCPGTVDDAPAPAGSVTWRFLYKGQTDWVSGKMPATCRHYTRSCN